ncbi:MAG: SNF2 helicase associated domain-containing protein [Akkermansiaceae bacterium]|nr:SNF2 helicase associated domain-containing protein [Akkermansiaceae bacterium]
MQITEQWVGQSAGGRVFKDARALLRLGKVAQVTRKDSSEGAVFQGQVGTGNRPMRVVVKVLGPTQVKNLCGCTMARSTGAMCEHAAALLLASIPSEAAPRKQDQTGGRDHRLPPEPCKGHPVMPLEVRLSPRFPHEAVRAIHLKRAEGAEVNQADRTLTQWLTAHVGQAGAAMLSLPEDQLAGFYQSLDGHTRVYSGDTHLVIQSAVLRPSLDLELESGDEGDVMWLKLGGGDGAQQELVMLGGKLAEWDSWLGQLAVASSDTQQLGSAVDLSELLAGDWLQMDAGDFVQSLELMAGAFQLPGDLGGLDIHEAEPVIELEIAGSTRALQARLVAVYAENARLPLASTHQVSVEFPLASDQPGQWLVRNPEYEQQAIARLMESGFQVLEASGSLFLRGEDEVIDFLTTMLPALRQQWVVKTEAKLVQVESKLDRIVPRVEVEGGGRQAGTDWLACEVSWQVGGETLDRDTVRRLLQSGSRTLSLPRGGKAVISHFDAEVMEGFLLDTDPRQEDGRYYFPVQQEAYLQRLRAFYGAHGPTEEEPVPALPDELAAQLRAYQTEGVEWLYRSAVRTGGALLADDMGLGKTLQTLAFVQHWKTHGGDAARGPALVVCPATLLGNWRDEAAKWVPRLNVLVMHGPRRKDYYEVMEVADIIVTSYALLDKDCAHYQKIQLGALILDEASAIRNPDTIAAKAARKVKAACRVAITGTPVENSVRDLWSVYQFLMPGYLGGREDFRRRYEVPCAAEVPDRVAMQRLRWRTSPFMLRRTKSLVAKDLPPKIESVVWCDPSPMQRDQYQAILRHGAEKVDQLRAQSGKDGARMQMLTVLLRLRQSCCDLRLLDDKLKGKSLSDVSAKLARLMELLDEAQRGGHRVLVFSQFTSMLALIREELDREDIDYCYLDGSTLDRAGVVDRFQKPGGPPVFLISLKAGGYGLTLTAADTVVLFDPWWNPAVEAQAADRIHRIGQTKPATIYKLITRGTVEEKILRLQERKRSVITAAMGDVGDESGPMMTGLTEREMLELLE